MASPMTARLLPASPKSPRKLPAQDGTVRGSLGCGQRPIGRAPMASEPKPLRCAIYTRKSTEHGLEQEFNSLDAQRDACEAYILRSIYKESGFAGLEAPPSTLR